MEFSITEILSIIWKQKKFIILGTVIGLFLFYTYNKYLTNPVYISSVQLYVSSTEGIDAASDLNSLSYAQKVVNTYINFLQTQAFYNEIRKQSGLSYTAGQIRSMTKMQSVNNTEIFSITVTANNAEDSYKLVSTMQKEAPELIKSIKGTAAEISVVDPAVYPAGPAGPNIRLNTLMGGLIGLITVILVSLLWEIINNSVKNQDDLKKKYDKPILGAIPEFNPSHKKAIPILKIIPFKNQNLSAGLLHQKYNDEIRFLSAEAYNSLRSSLHFLLRNDGCKKIIINSPNSFEGKSTISVNLAQAIAQTGSKVLLLDCDLRKGTLHNYFKLKSYPGISDVLSRTKTEADVIQNSKYSNLKIITMGSIPPNPAELLESVQMEELVGRLEKQFDYIIFDTPPVNIVTDVFGLIKLADGIILVVKEQFTTHADIIETLTKYELVKAYILGFVLNGYNINHGGKKKYNYYYRNS